MKKDTLTYLLNLESKYSSWISGFKYTKTPKRHEKAYTDGMIQGIEFCANEIRKILANNIKII
jgi:hypothetical protein